MRAVAEFLASLSGAITLTAGIVAAAVVFAVVSVYRPLRNARRAIADCRSVVVERLGDPPLPEHLEHVSDGLRKHKPLSQAWEDFRGALVVFDISSQIKAIHRVRFAADFFNEGRIIPDYFNLRLVHVFPNYLTGFGILGTFIGLSVGIFLANQGLTVNRLDEMRTSLAELLGGASTAFWTSVAGLAGSIVLGWWSRARLRELGNSLNELAAEIDKRIAPLAMEYLLMEALKEARQQSAELRHFNTKLAVSIAEALDERLAARLVPKLEQVLGAIDRLRDEQVMFNQESLGRLLSQFQQGLERAAGREMDALAAAIRQTKEGLAEAGEMLARQRESVAASLAAGLASFESGVKALSERLALAGAPMVDAATRWAEAIGQAEALLQNVLDAADAVEKALGEAAAAVRAGGESLRAGVADTQAVLKATGELLESSKGAVREIAEATGQLARASGGLSQASSALRRQVETLTSTWEQQRERFQGLDQELARAFDRLTAGMKDAMDQAGAILGKAHDHLAEAVRVIEALVSELQETVDDLSERVNGRLRGTQDGATQ